MKTTILHHNGAVTYFSFHRQVWVKHASSMPAHEIATRPEPLRAKLIRHLAPRLNHAKRRTLYQKHRNP
jgi:hypothetical protein